MPLELGMALARRFMDAASEHDWLVLVPYGHAYTRFISDLAAYDPVAYDGTAAGVVVAVMPWLATRPDAVATVTPREVLALLPAFQKRREAVSDAWGGLAPWSEVIMAAIEIAQDLS